jgi:hypothetical protein
MDEPDRDIIDITNPAEQHLAQHREYCRALIAHRAPEIDAGEIADAYGIIPTEADPGAIWNEVMERMIDAVEALESRLDRIEATMKEDDDDDDERRGRRQASG